MSVCEDCWKEATRRAQSAQRSTVDFYMAVLGEAEQFISSGNRPPWHRQLVDLVPAPDAREEGRDERE